MLFTRWNSGVFDGWSKWENCVSLKCKHHLISSKWPYCELCVKWTKRITCYYRVALVVVLVFVVIVIVFVVVVELVPCTIVVYCEQRVERKRRQSENDDYYYDFYASWNANDPFEAVSENMYCFLLYFMCALVLLSFHKQRHSFRSIFLAHSVAYWMLFPASGLMVTDIIFRFSSFYWARSFSNLFCLPQFSFHPISCVLQCTY